MNKSKRTEANALGKELKYAEEKTLEERPTPE